MSFGEAIQTVFRKYAEFMGRAGRAEFWWWALFNVLVASALGLFNGSGSETTPTSVHCSPVSGASRSCCRASPWASDDFATLATPGVGCSFSWPRSRVASCSSFLWAQPTKGTETVPPPPAATA